MRSLEDILISVPAILIGLTFHEYAHAFIAWKKGDNTAKQAGRLTFNPFVHLDLFGTLMLLWGPFGWAKPVPVNTMNLDNPKRDSIYVSAAGPVSNILLALLFGYFYRFLIFSGAVSSFPKEIIPILHNCIIINLGLSFFNLIPVPPLDGSHILMGFLPSEKIVLYLKFVQHAPKILLGLLVAEWVFHIPLFSTIIYPLWKPYIRFWLFIIFGGKVM